MSADGSILTIEKPATANTATTTLADVLRHLEADAGLDPGRRRELCSALRKVCQVIGADPTMLLAQPRHLRILLAKVTPAVAGVSPGRWSNIRSLTLKALKHAGIKSMPGRYREPHAPEWELLRTRLPDRRFQSGLSRFMSYCTSHGIGPTEVIADTFAQFGAELEAHSISRDPGGIYRDTTKLWNTASATIPVWPKLQVKVPVRRQDFSLRLDEFPTSFGEDLERFLSKGAEPNVFSDSYCRPVRPLTLRNRRQNILMAATALVKSGVSAAQLTGLAVLVGFENAKAALHFLYDRAGGKTTGHIYQIASLLKTIAQHYVGTGEKPVDRLRSLCRDLKPKTAGLTEKNKRFLRQFADLDKLVSLLMLPRRLLEEVERYDAGRRDAVRIELALAIAIEIVIPIRSNNLSGLRIDRHIQREGKTAFLSIPAEETKNDNAIDAELPPWLLRLLDRYLENYRPKLLTAPSPWLFPGENGGRRKAGGFSAQISALIAKEAGVTMTLHQFRHLAAKLYLDRHPDGFDTVRRLLGHKSIVTTMRFYREFESLLATRRYSELLEKLLGDAQWQVPPMARAGRRP